MTWLKIGQQATTENKDESFEINPVEFKKTMDQVGTLNTEFSTFRTETKSVNDRMLAFLDQQEQDRTARESETARQREVANRPAPISFEDDPAGALEARLKPLTDNQLALNSRLMRREVFDNERFEYYADPKVKEEVDRMIDAQPLANQCNPGVLENAYKVVVYNHLDEIKENKLKSRFAAAVTPASGVGAPSAGGDPTALPKLTDEERNIARSFGMKDEEYAQQKKEMLDQQEMSHV